MCCTNPHSYTNFDFALTLTPSQLQMHSLHTEITHLPHICSTRPGRKVPSVSIYMHFPSPPPSLRGNCIAASFED